MKTTSTIAALFLSIGLSAQTLPPAPAQDRIVEAGIHIEKAGKARNTAILAMLGGTLLGVAAIAQADGEDSMITAGGALAGVGAVVAFGINIGANGREKKAGRILQGK